LFSLLFFSGVLAKRLKNSKGISFSMIGKKEVVEEIIRVDKLDRATCEALRGTMDEEGKCLIRYQENPADPDTLLIKAIKYRQRSPPSLE